MSTVGASTSLHSLTPNQFHKVCPSRSNLGPPVCGDGTPFCFFVSRPAQKFHSNDKLLIEVMGGGACWDEETCNKQSNYLYVSENLDNFLGYSCTEIQSNGGQGNNNNMPINMLCGSQLGDTDLRTYTTIVIPYCTQDIHIGSSTASYNGETVHHMGGNNLLSVMEYVYRNLPSLRHAIVTGCSAGGTAVPTVYRALDNHYNNRFSRRTQISVLADSPVFLTPSYFLEYGIVNWNPDKLLKHMGIPTRFRQSTDYPIKIWDYILRSGANKDQWGVVSHTYDPVSMAYYQAMSGSYNDNDDGDQRRLEDGDSDAWYSELVGSLGTVQNKHKNVDTFWIDGQGHCSFGLYYGLQESGFESWASGIVSEQQLFRSTPSTKAFGIAALFGVGLLALLWKMKRRTESSKDALLDDDKEDSPEVGRLRQGLRQSLARFEPYPVTAAYALVVSIYFWTMIIQADLAHFLNNPSLGPSAVNLSAYGINNPSMVVFRFQLYRLVSANFLCSGILTYLYLTIYLWFRTRKMEAEMKSTQDFMVVVVVVAVLSGVVYCLFGDLSAGASCASMAMVMGLQSCNLFLNKARWYSVMFLVLDFCIISALFPFNSWIILLAAILTGPLVWVDSKTKARVVLQKGEPRSRRNWLLLLGLLSGLLALPFMVLPFSSPSKVYLEPYYTGCRLYWSDEIGELSSAFSNDDDEAGDQRRQLFDFDGACAQFCIPNIAPSFVVDRVLSTRGIDAIHRGQCVENGYDTHVLDKTYSFLSYSLDVELYYYPSDDDN